MRRVLVIVVELTGLGTIGAGIWAIYWPVGLIAIGAIFVVIAQVMSDTASSDS